MGPARVALLPPHAAPRPLWPEGSQRCSVKNRMQANNELVRHRSAGPSCRFAPRGYVVLLEDPAWPLTARCSRRAPSPRKRSTTASPRWWRCAGCCSLDAAPGNAQVPRALQQNVVQGPTGLPRRGPRRRPAGPGVRKRQVLVHPLSLGSFSFLLRHRPCAGRSYGGGSSTKVVQHRLQRRARRDSACSARHQGGSFAPKSKTIH